MNSDQLQIENFLKHHGLNHSLQARLLDLISELGEFSKEILKATEYGSKPAVITEESIEEFGDCYFSFLTLANKMGIDLTEAITTTLEKYKKRFDETNSIGSS